MIQASRRLTQMKYQLPSPRNLCQDAKERLTLCWNHFAQRSLMNLPESFQLFGGNLGMMQQLNYTDMKRIS